MVFDGTTATTAESTPSQNATDIVSFTLTSKGSNAEVSVGIFFGSAITYLLFEEAVNANTSFIYTGKPIRVLPNYKIFISTNAQIDFYFTIL